MRLPTVQLRLGHLFVVVSFLCLMCFGVVYGLRLQEKRGDPTGPVVDRKAWPSALEELVVKGNLDELEIQQVKVYCRKRTDRYQEYFWQLKTPKLLEILSKRQELVPAMITKNIMKSFWERLPTSWMVRRTGEDEVVMLRGLESTPHDGETYVVLHNKESMIVWYNLRWDDAL